MAERIEFQWLIEETPREPLREYARLYVHRYGECEECTVDDLVAALKAAPDSVQDAVLAPFAHDKGKALVAIREWQVRAEKAERDAFEARSLVKDAHATLDKAGVSKHMEIRISLSGGEPLVGSGVGISEGLPTRIGWLVRQRDDWKSRAENAERGVETVEGYLRDVLRVLGGQGDELAVEAAERVVKERDSAISRSTDLQSQRDAIATELRSFAAALGLSTDDTIESLAARCRTAVAWSIGMLRKRAEAAEADVRDLCGVIASLVDWISAGAIAHRDTWEQACLRSGRYREDILAARDSAVDREEKRDQKMTELRVRAEKADRELDRVVSVAAELRDDLDEMRGYSAQGWGWIKQIAHQLGVTIGQKTREEVVDECFVVGGTLRANRDSAIRDRDDAQSARDVATSELALAKESIRNLEEEINREREEFREYVAGDVRDWQAIRDALGGRVNELTVEAASRVIGELCTERSRREKSEDAMRACVHERDLLQRELADARCDLAILRRASQPESELAPGSRWEGYAVMEDDRTRISVVGPYLRVSHESAMLDCYSSDAIAVLRRAGLLHDEWVPRRGF